MKYNYEAVNSKNKRYKSTMIAESRSEVIANLQKRGLTALTIIEEADLTKKNLERQNKSIWDMELSNKDVHDIKIKKKRLLTLMHQMAIMMKAGISLSLAMEVMLDTESDKNLIKILNEINTELYNGIPLSQSMSSFKCFPNVLVNIVQAGESNGRLDMSFEQCAGILQKEITLSGKLKSAMGYPIFLLGMTLALIIIMTVFVLPTFKGMFESFGAELPLITLTVMGVSNFIIGYWWLIITIVAAIVITVKMLLKYSDSAKMIWAVAIMKIPVVGKVVRLTYIARFCNMLATLTEAGVSILRSLELARDVIPNIYIKDCLTQIIEDVKIGTPINVSMSRYKVFDTLLVSMVRVGEESGMLSESLRKMADLYEQQTTEATHRLTEAMTPAMTVIIALVVGVVVVSIVIPMFSMYDVIGNG